jgi:hypothetical protein
MLNVRKREAMLLALIPIAGIPIKAIRHMAMSCI